VISTPRFGDPYLGTGAFLGSRLRELLHDLRLF
jgi:hypothetical protein